MDWWVGAEGGREEEFGGDKGEETVGGDEK